MKTYVMEHKSTSEDCSPGSVYWRKLTLDAQVSNYIVGARALGYAPDGVLYDVLRKPALRPLGANSRRATPETPDEYRLRCLEDIQAKPEHYYQRGVVVRLESEEQDAAFDAWQTADQIRLSRHAGRWPRNVDSCSQFNRLCDYWPVCSGETTIDDPLHYAKGDTHPELDGKHHLSLFTSSSSRSYRACARRYYYAYEMAVHSRRDVGALMFGRRMHLALEAWLKNGQSLEAALAVVRTGEYGFDSAKLEAMLIGYHARWSGEPLETLAVEVEFTADLVNPESGGKSRTFCRAGKIDAIVRRQDVREREEDDHGEHDAGTATA